jgi:hypothetical protein
MGVCLGVYEVVHGDDFQVAALSVPNRLEHLPSDPPEPVDADLGYHGESS